MGIKNKKLVIDNSIDNILSNRFNINTSEKKFNKLVNILKDNITLINMGSEILRDNDVYKMRISPEIMEGIKNGKFVEFRDSNRKFLGDFIDTKTGNVVGKARWERENFNQILNFAQMAQTIAVQAKLNDIFDYMEVVDEKLDILIRGQHSDRIAHIKTGIELFEDAFKCDNKNYDLKEAKKSLMLGKNQLLSSLKDQSRIIDEKPVINGVVDKTKSFFKNPEVKWVKRLNDLFPLFKESIEYSIVATKYITYIQFELGRSSESIENQIISFQEELSEFVTKMRPKIEAIEYKPQLSPGEFIKKIDQFTNTEISLDNYSQIEFEIKGEALLNG